MLRTERMKQNGKGKKRRRKVKFISFIIFTFILITLVIMWGINSLSSSKLEVMKPKITLEKYETTVKYFNETESAPIINWIMEDKTDYYQYKRFDEYNGELGFYTSNNTFVIDSESGLIEGEFAPEKDQYKSTKHFGDLKISINDYTHSDDSITAKDKKFKEVWTFTPKYNDFTFWHGFMKTDFDSKTVYNWGYFIEGKFTKASGLYALDVNSGKVKWNYVTEDKLQNIFKNPNKDELYIATANSLIAVSTETGAVNWSVPTNDFVISSLGANEEKVIARTSKGEIKVYDALNGNEKVSVRPTDNWEFWEGLPACVYENTLVVSAGESIKAYEINTGLKKWEVLFESDELHSKFEFYDSPYYNNGSLYIKNLDEDYWVSLEFPKK
jgi:outer membrane protein assembly factor BamB